MDERYSRQILFSAVGTSGQERIQSAKVTVVGCGALGSVSTELLARAGVGSLTIIDRDFVEISNLQRQSLFTEEDARLGTPKAVAAEKAIRSINSSVDVHGVIRDVTFDNIEQLCGESDVIVDGTDNFEIRFLINDFSVSKGIKWIYGAALGSYGMGLAICPGETACLRCIYPEPPASGTSDTCETAGILSPVIHVVSAFQVTQTLRILVGAPVSEAILQVDVWKDDWRQVKVGGAQYDCACCQKRIFEFLEGGGRTRAVSLCGRNAVQVSPQRSGTIDLGTLARQLKENFDVQTNEYLLKVFCGEQQMILFEDGRAIIKGTDDPSLARNIYARLVGN